jgi:hypothetical protein
MTTTEQNAEQVGANAFRADHKLSRNPYWFPKSNPTMKALEAAWERGWKAAQKADWNYYPMAGR